MPLSGANVVKKDEPRLDTNPSASRGSRRAKKNKKAAKRRNTAPVQQEDTASEGKKVDGAHAEDIATLKQIVTDMFCDDLVRQYGATKSVRILSSKENDPPIDMIIKAGIIPRCIQFLRCKQFPRLQFEAAWALTNITSGNKSQTGVVVEAGAVDAFIDLLKASSFPLVDQAIWALGNIAGDGPVFRDLIISKGVVSKLMTFTLKSEMAPFHRNISWTLASICRGKCPPPPQESRAAVLAALTQLIESDDMETIGNVCWALAYLSDGPNEKIEQVVKAGFVPRLVELLVCGSDDVITACLQTIANICGGTDSQAQIVVSAGALSLLPELLRAKNSDIVIKASLIVYNVSAGAIEQITEIIDAGIVPPLLDIMKSGEYEAQLHAVSVMNNISSSGDEDHLAYLCEMDTLNIMCNMLTSREWQNMFRRIHTVKKVMKAMKKIKRISRAARALETPEVPEENEQFEFSQEDDTEEIISCGRINSVVNDEFPRNVDFIPYDIPEED